jgi:hypothetical protein
MRVARAARLEQRVLPQPFNSEGVPIIAVNEKSGCGFLSCSVMIDPHSEYRNKKVRFIRFATYSVRESSRRANAQCRRCGYDGGDFPEQYRDWLMSHKD